MVVASGAAVALLARRLLLDLVVNGLLRVVERVLDVDLRVPVLVGVLALLFQAAAVQGATRHTGVGVRRRLLLVFVELELEQRLFPFRLDEYLGEELLVDRVDVAHAQEYDAQLDLSTLGWWWWLRCWRRRRARHLVVSALAVVLRFG